MNFEIGSNENSGGRGRISVSRWTAGAASGRIARLRLAAREKQKASRPCRRVKLWGNATKHRHRLQNELMQEQTPLLSETRKFLMSDA
jgi:hypothetical protein